MISGIIEKGPSADQTKTKERVQHSAEPDKRNTPDFMDIPEGSPEQMEFHTSPPEKQEKTEEKPPHTEPDKPVPRSSVFHVRESIPKALRDLMEEKLVSEEEIQHVVADRGYYPKSTPILNYDPNFISGVLVGAWPQVYGMIEKLRETYEIPFEEDKK